MPVFVSDSLKWFWEQRASQSSWSGQQRSDGRLRRLNTVYRRHGPCSVSPSSGFCNKQTKLNSFVGFWVKPQRKTHFKLSKLYPKCRSSDTVLFFKQYIFPLSLTCLYVNFPPEMSEKWNRAWDWFLSHLDCIFTWPTQWQSCHKITKSKMSPRFLF